MRRIIITAITVSWLATAGAAWAGEAEQGAGQRMAEAAQAFIGVLNDNQLEHARMDYDDERRMRWHYWPLWERDGLMLRDMNKEQQEHVLALLEASLSPTGYEKALVTMELEKIIHELEYDGPIRDYLRYYFTVYGEPGDEGTWGWSVEGHHLVFNFVVHDGVLVNVTPAFIGANPAIVRDNAGTGPALGTRNLADQELAGFALFESLAEEQLGTVIVSSETSHDMDEGFKPQTDLVEPQGLPAADMTDAQRDQLRAIIAAFMDNVPAELTGPYMDRVEAEFDETHFAWRGSTAIEDNVASERYSFRIQSPTFVMMLYNSMRDDAGNDPNHIHTIWRTIGRDFMPALD